MRGVTNAALMQLMWSNGTRQQYTFYISLTSNFSIWILEVEDSLQKFNSFWGWDLRCEGLFSRPKRLMMMIAVHCRCPQHTLQCCSAAAVGNWSFIFMNWTQFRVEGKMKIWPCNVRTSAADDPSVSQSDFTIMEEAYSWLKEPTSAFTFKTLC